MCYYFLAASHLAWVTVSSVSDSSFTKKLLPVAVSCLTRPELVYLKVNNTGSISAYERDSVVEYIGWKNKPWFKSSSTVWNLCYPGLFNISKPK